MSSDSLNYGTYNDPLSMRLPQIMCGSCGSRNLTLYNKKVKNSLKENAGMTIQEAYNKNNIRMCCRAAMAADFVIPDVVHNPLAIEGKIDVENMTREEVEDAASKYIGNMLISERFPVEKRQTSTYLADGVKYPIYEYIAKDEDGSVLASFTPPIRNGKQSAVTKWLEVPIFGNGAPLTVEDDERGGLSRSFVLVPKIISIYELKKYK